MKLINQTHKQKRKKKAEKKKSSEIITKIIIIILHSTNKIDIDIDKSDI